MNEYSIPYTLKTYPRINNKAPPEFKALHKLGKAPLLTDDAITLVESGAIAEYCLQKANIIVGHEERMWMYFSEGTLLLHALAITYSRWSINDPVPRGQCEDFMRGNVMNDMRYIEDSLLGREYLCGEFGVADIMLLFSVEFTIFNNLGITKEDRFPNIEAWVERCRARPAYQKSKKEAPHEM